LQILARALALSLCLPHSFVRQTAQQKIIANRTSKKNTNKTKANKANKMKTPDNIANRDGLGKRDIINGNHCWRSHCAAT
jgi:hypothetical protein